MLSSKADGSGSARAATSEMVPSVAASGPRTLRVHQLASPASCSNPDIVAGVVHAIAELVRVEVQAQVRSALTERAAFPDLLSTAEAARYVRVTPRTIRRWLEQGKLHALHAGRELRIDRAELDRLMRSRSRRARRAMAPEQLARELAVRH